MKITTLAAAALFGMALTFFAPAASATPQRLATLDTLMTQTTSTAEKVHYRRYRHSHRRRYRPTIVIAPRIVVRRGHSRRHLHRHCHRRVCHRHRHRRGHHR